MEESLDGREKETIGEVFSSLRYTNSYDLFLEIREKDKMFLPYNIGGKFSYNSYCICLFYFEIIRQSN